MIRDILSSMRCLALIFGIVAVSNLFASHGEVPRHFIVEGNWVYYRLAHTPERCLSKVWATAPRVTNPSPCSNNVGKCVLTTDSIQRRFNHESGLSVALMFLPNLDWTIEARATGLLKWSASKSATCPGALRLPIDPNYTYDYKYADHASARYRSSFDTIELNLFGHITPRRKNYFSGSYIIGARFVEIDERIRLRYVNEGRTSKYWAKTWNHMFGPQLGLDLSTFPNHWFSWGLNFKLGLLGNFAKQESIMRDLHNSIVLRDFDHKAFNLSWMGEIAPFFLFRPTRWSYIRFSYQVFWLSDIAAAPCQLGLKSYGGNVVDNNADRVYYGGYIGLGVEF